METTGVTQHSCVCLLRWFTGTAETRGRIEGNRVGRTKKFGVDKEIVAVAGKKHGGEFGDRTKLFTDVAILPCTGIC